MFHHILARQQQQRERQANDRPVSLLAPPRSPRAPPPPGDSRAMGGRANPADQQLQYSACTPPASGSSSSSSYEGPRAVVQSKAGRGSGSSNRLPHVLPADDGPSTSYCSLNGLKKIAELHKGKHSTVCSYLDVSTGQMVAVKTYYKRTMAKRHYRNVRREVAISRLLAKQRFTGAVRLLGAFDDESHIYLIHESCAVGDLYSRLMHSGGLLAEAEVCRDVVVPLLLTLTFLHASHIVHRDIKPENIFFTADGALRLGDFGLSIDARAERPTSRVGTLDYMAPEVVGMPSPDEIQRRGLAPHQIGHYGCKVDVWAAGILTYELICGRPPFEVDDVKQTEQLIKFADITFPAHMSPLCRSFIQQALTKRPESRPSAAQLFQHPWVQAHYQPMVQRQTGTAAAPAAAALLTGEAFTPELRRTVSQPPSPSKSMPAAEAGAAAAAAAGRTPAAVALPPFLPLSQAKMAHKVRLLSPGGPPGSSNACTRPRRRLSDPLARVHLAPPQPAELGAPEAAAPPSTPSPAPAPTCVSDDAGAAAVLAAEVHEQEDACSNGMASVCFETPGTPGLQTTPLQRQRPAQPQRPLGRTPFMLPLGTPCGGGGSSNSSGCGGLSSAIAAAGAQVQPAAGVAGPGVRKAAAPGRSRFAVAALALENDAAHAAAALSESTDALSPVLQARPASFTSLGGSSSNLAVLQARAASFTSLVGGNGSGSNLQLQARASSFTSFGGSSSNLTNINPLGSSRSGSKQALELLESPAGGNASNGAWAAAAGLAEEALQQLQL